MINSLHVLRLVAVTWNGSLFLTLSHLCVLLPWCWSATRKTDVLHCQRHQGFCVSTLARLSHCMHSRVSTGLQQGWASWCLASFSLSKSGVSFVLMAVSTQRDLRPSRPPVPKRFIDGSQVCWLETDPEGDEVGVDRWHEIAAKGLVSEWRVCWRLISRVTGWSGKLA